MTLPEPILRSMRFALGCLYILWLGAVLAGATETSIAAGVVASAALFAATFLVLMVIAVRWAEATPGRRQFRISSLMLWMALAGAYLGVVRWVLVQTGLAEQAWTLRGVASTALGALSAVVLSLPVWLLLAESLMWFAAWLVHRRWIQVVLGRDRHRPLGD